MAKTTGKEVIEPKEPTEPIEPVEPTEPKTFTQEELDAAEAKGKELGGVEAWEKYQGIQQTVSAKERRIKELEAQQPQSPKISQIQKEMLDLMSGDAISDDPGRQGRIQQLKAELTNLERIQTQEAFIKQKREEMNRKITDAGFNPSDEVLEGVEDAFDLSCFDGKFERVDRKLDRILKAKPVNLPSTEKKETEDERAERLSDEKLHKKMEERGMLVSETEGPSASVDSFQAFEEKYNKGLISREVYEERARREGKL